MQGQENIAEARQDVKDYVAGGLPKMAYGEVPYIFAHAAAGSKVQLGLIMANGKVLALPALRDPYSCEISICCILIRITGIMCS